MLLSGGRNADLPSIHALNKYILNPSLGQVLSNTLVPYPQELPVFVTDTALVLFEFLI